MAPWFQAGTDPAGRNNAYSFEIIRNTGRINAYSSRTARNTGRINAPPTGDRCKIFCRGAINGALVPGGYGSRRGAIDGALVSGGYGSGGARQVQNLP